MQRTARTTLTILRYIIAAVYAHDAGLALIHGWIGGDGLMKRIADALASNSIPSFYRSAPSSF